MRLLCGSLTKINCEAVVAVTVTLPAGDRTKPSAGRLDLVSAGRVDHQVERRHATVRRDSRAREHSLAM